MVRRVLGLIAVSATLGASACGASDESHVSAPTEQASAAASSAPPTTDTTAEPAPAPDSPASAGGAGEIEMSPPDPIEQYVLILGEVDGTSIPIESGLAPSLVIGGDRWNGRIGCALYEVTAAIGGEGQLDLSDIGLFTDGCPDGVIDPAGDLFIAALGRAVVLTSSNELLRLSGPDVDLLFERPDTTPPLPTEGLAGSFILQSGILDGDSLVVLTDSEPTLVIDGNDWTGQAPCNDYGSTVDVRNSDLTVGEVSRTMAGCFPDEIMVSEEQYIAAFQRTTRFDLDDDVLVLNGDGVELTFERGQRPPVPTPLPSGFDDIPSGNIGAAVTDERVLVGIEDDESFGVADLSTSLPESTSIVDLDVISEGAVVLGTRPADDDGSTNCLAEIIRVDADNQPSMIAANAITPSVNRDARQPQVAFGVIERINDICFVTGLAIVDLGTGDRTDLDIDDVPDSGFPDWNLTWSADGTSLLATSGRLITNAGLDGTSTTIETPLLMAVPTADGDAVVGMSGCCTGTASLARYDLDTGTLTELAALNGHIQSIRAEHDRILIVTTNGIASVYDDSNGLVPLTTTPHPVVDVRLATPRPN